jgi:hypothetical protein
VERRVRTGVQASFGGDRSIRLQSRSLKRLEQLTFQDVKTDCPARRRDIRVVDLEIDDGQSARCLKPQR